jgi:acid stress-induced BolA-like protein IbaG/YrbA
MTMTAADIQQCIEQKLPNSVATVTGDDGVHFEALVICPAFAGKNMLTQHRMVYEALGDKMREAIHALSLQTRAE